MKIIISILFLLILNSCGQKSSSSNSGNSESPKKDPIHSSCNEFLRSNDNLKTIALTANRARLKCGLSENEVLNLMI